MRPDEIERVRWSRDLLSRDLSPPARGISTTTEAAIDPHRLKDAAYHNVGGAPSGAPADYEVVHCARTVVSEQSGEHLQDVPRQSERPHDDALQLDEFTLSSSSGSAISLPEADTAAEETAASSEDDRSESPWTSVGADGSLTIESNGGPPGPSPVQGRKGTPASNSADSGSLPPWVPFPGVPFLPPKNPTGDAASTSTSRLPHPPWVWTGDDTPHFPHPPLPPPDQPLRHLLCGAIDGALDAAIRLALSLCTSATPDAEPRRSQTSKSRPAPRVDRPAFSEELGLSYSWTSSS